MVCLLTAYAAAFADNKLMVEVSLRDGTKPHFALNDSPKIYITNNNVRIVTANNEVAFPRANVLAYSIKKDDDQSVAGIGNDKDILFSIEGATITVTGMPTDGTAVLIDTNGRIISSAKGNPATLHAPQSGVYIVKALSATFKVTVVK